MELHKCHNTLAERREPSEECHREIHSLGQRDSSPKNENSVLFWTPVTFIILRFYAFKMVLVWSLRRTHLKDVCLREWERGETLSLP